MGVFSDLFSDGDWSSAQSVSKRIRELERRGRRGDVRARAQLFCYYESKERGDTSAYSQLYFLDDLC